MQAISRTETKSLPSREKKKPSMGGTVAAPGKVKEWHGLRNGVRPNGPSWREKIASSFQERTRTDEGGKSKKPKCIGKNGKKDDVKAELGDRETLLKASINQKAIGGRPDDIGLVARIVCNHRTTKKKTLKRNPKVGHHTSTAGLESQ